MGTLRQLAPLWFFVSSVLAQSPPKFMGRAITITTPGFEDAEHMFPKGPATLCLAGAQRQCYTAPEKFGGNPEATVVQVDKNTPAIFFSAASGGVSGWMIHFALLHPGTGKELENLFMSVPSVSSQSEHAFWADMSISDAKIFVTADYVWGPSECHICDHRYMISAYILNTPTGLDCCNNYYLGDQYMTVGKYGEGSKILNSERQEIIARLRRVKQQSPH
jgi:hypothetical protein